MKLPGVVSRHRSVFVVALVVVGIATAVFLTVRAGTGGGTAGPATTKPRLGGPTEELVRLLVDGGGVNFDAVYSAADPAGAQDSAHLWRRPPLGRLDSDSGTGDGARQQALLVTASGPLSCTRQGQGPWSCAPKPGLNLGALGVVPPTLLAQLAGLDVTARDDRVSGQAVRCFTLAPKPTQPPASGGTGPGAEICLTPDGIPARVTSGSARIEMVSVQRGRLPDSVFDPPGPIG